MDWQRQHFGQRSDVDLEEPDRVFHLHLGQGRQGPMASLCVAGSASSCTAAATARPWAWRLERKPGGGVDGHHRLDGSVPLVDPFCGSATLLIEAVSRVLSRAPGLPPGAAWGLPITPSRRFSCLQWPDADLACGARKWWQPLSRLTWARGNRLRQ